MSGHITAVCSYIEIKGTYLSSVKTKECPNGHSYYYGIPHKFCTQCGGILSLIESQAQQVPIESLYDILDDSEAIEFGTYLQSPTYCKPENGDGIVVFDYSQVVDDRSCEITTDTIKTIEDFKEEHSDFFKLLDTKDTLTYEVKFGVISYTEY